MKNIKCNKMKILKFISLSLIWMCVLGGVFLIYCTYDLPDFNKINTLERKRKITLLNLDGEVLANYGDLYNGYAKYDNIPSFVINAVLATEDRRFFEHKGIDISGLFRAIIANLRAGRTVQGGSTISQQLAKMIYLTPKKNIKRKIQELIFSFYLEKKYSKQEIIEAYLNRAYLGSGIYGIAAAAKYYFAKNVQELSLMESAIIAGLLKAPNTYSPKNNPEKSGERGYRVLLNMVNAGYLKKDELKHALKEPVILSDSEYGSIQKSYYTNFAYDQANKITELLPEVNIAAYIVMNESLQKKVDQVLARQIKQHGKNLAVTQAAAVVMRKDGQILAISGGVDLTISYFNRAVQAFRQPGSAFKHIVYATAFENGYTPNDLEVDEPFTINQWSPRNSNRKFQGEMSLRNAFALSINTIAVKLSEAVGRNNVIEMARKMGITSIMQPFPALALGSEAVNLLDLTTSYAVIANGGISITPYIISKIIDNNGDLIYKHAVFSEKILSDKTVGYLKDILLSSVEYGTSKRAQILNKQVWGKTGTTQDNKDALFIGFTDDIVVGVWVGNDDNKATKTGGAYLPIIIWKDIVMAYNNINE